MPVSVRSIKISEVTTTTLRRGSDTSPSPKLFAVQSDLPSAQRIYVDMSVQERDPCPHRILDDIGGAFSMGAIGGGLWHSIKGARNSPRGERLLGSATAVKARVPIIGGNFAVWGGLFSAFDCTLVAIRKKEDPWNSIISGATGRVCSPRGRLPRRLEIGGRRRRPARDDRRPPDLHDEDALGAGRSAVRAAGATPATGARCASRIPQHASAQLGAHGRLGACDTGRVSGYLVVCVCAISVRFALNKSHILTHQSTVRISLASAAYSVAGLAASPQSARQSSRRRA